MSATKNGYPSDPVWDLKATSRMGLSVWIPEKEVSLGHLPGFHRIRLVFSSLLIFLYQKRILNIQIIYKLHVHKERDIIRSLCHT